MKLRWPVEHGGVRLKRRKTARPLDLDRTILLIFRSERAKGDWSLLQKVNQKSVRQLLGFSAARFSIEIVKTANFGRQLQVLVRAKSRVSLQNFLRVFAGALALSITGAKRGVKRGKFWDHLTYSRILETSEVLKHVLKHTMTRAFNFAQGESLQQDFFRAASATPLKL